MDVVNDLQDVEAEKALIRLLIGKIDLMAEIDGRLDPGDFYGVAHRNIYAALMEMYAANMTVDLVTLADYLTKTDRMKHVGGVTYLTNLFNGLMNKGGLNEYVTIVKEYSDRRFIWRIGDWLKCSAHDKTALVDELKSSALDAFDKIQKVKTEDDKDGLLQAYEALITNTPLGIETGFDEIDYTLKGMKKGNLIVLAGRPAMGKTALALNIISNLCEAGKEVMFYSLEMSKEEIFKRLITASAQLSESNIKAQIAKDNATKNNSFTEEVLNYRNKESQALWNRLQSAMDKVYKWNLSIVEKGRCGIQDLRIAAKINQKKKGLDIVVIDYLQLMGADGYRDNRVGEISYITRQLKLLAKELEIPILILSQLSRNVESRSDKRPTLSDLRDSGSIEQDADVVMLMYRDLYYRTNGDDWTEVNIAKNRHGGNSTARLDFYPEIGKFRDHKGFAGKVVKNEFPK